MKKFLLSLVLVLATLPANATNWQYLNTDSKNVDLFIDTDSISAINNDECYYAIKFNSNNKPEQVAYIKSNSKTNYIGIITSEDYNFEKYRPDVVFRNAHVFMKPLNEKSFLNYSHQYAIGFISNNLATEVDENTVPVSYSNCKEYVSKVGTLLNSNWQPPKSGRNTQAKIVLTIGTDGSLQNYKFTKSSGDKTTDRSIISAVEKTVPYPAFPQKILNTNAADFPFVFDYALFVKSVK